MSHSFFSRQISLKEVGLEGQHKLQTSSVAVIGAGGLGSPCLQYLAAAGIGSICIIDGDQVDLSNLHRQIIYSPEDCGKNKAKSAANKLGQQFPHTKFLFIEEYLSQKNISILDGYDYIVEGGDNFKLKFLIHDYCYQKKINLVSSSIHKFDGQLLHFPYSSAQENSSSPCLRCLWPDEPEKGCVGTCAEEGVLGVTPGLFGTLMACEVIKGLLGLEILPFGELFSFDLRSLQVQKLKWKKSNDCPLCGNGKMSDSIEINIQDIKNPEEYLWIDIRNPFEWVEGFENNFPYSRFMQLPMNQLLSRLEEIKNEQKAIIFCAHGVRSFQMVSHLRGLGLHQFISLENGVGEILKINN